MICLLQATYMMTTIKLVLLCVPQERDLPSTNLAAYVTAW